VTTGRGSPYNARENQLYIAYDGLNALHVSNTAALINPLLGIQAIGDSVVVPERRRQQLDA
jgi:hypothetical protein